MVKTSMGRPHGETCLQKKDGKEKAGKERGKERGKGGEREGKDKDSRAECLMEAAAGSGARKGRLGIVAERGSNLSLIWCINHPCLLSAALPVSTLTLPLMTNG